MIKRILEISAEPYHLTVRLDQLTLRPHGPAAEPPAAVPCEDVGVIVVDNPGVTYSHQALTRLLDAGAAVVLCGPKHLPTGLILPLVTHVEVAARARLQVAAARPVRKRLWKQIIRAKIRNQATGLPADHPTRQRLLALATTVRSGDPANVEAHAAKLYWDAWRDGEPFRRDPDGTDAVNAMLNYGYAVVRAAVARALVSAGLNPALGLHHSNRGNPFCLADDLLEPLRPWVDAAVAGHCQIGPAAMDRDGKRALLSILHRTVRVGDQTGPLMVALHRSAASLVRCLEGADRKLLLPVEPRRRGSCN